MKRPLSETVRLTESVLMDGVFNRIIFLTCIHVTSIHTSLRKDLFITHIKSGVVSRTVSSLRSMYSLNT